MKIKLIHVYDYEIYIINNINTHLEILLPSVPVNSNYFYYNRKKLITIKILIINK